MVVAQPVVDQVGDHAAQQHGVAPDLDRARDRIDRHGPVGGDGELVGDAAHGGAELDRRPPVDPALAAGEHQQPVEQVVQLVGADQHPLAHPPQLAGIGVGVVERDVDLGADRGQRGAQLVAGVGDEPALRGKPGLQAIEHRVEGVGELADLVPGTVERQPLVEPLVGDPAGRSGHRVDRAQRAPRRDPADRGGQQRGADEHEDQLQRDLVEDRVGQPGRQRARDVAVEQPVRDDQDHRGRRGEQRGVERGQPGAQRPASPRRREPAASGACAHHIR